MLGILRIVALVMLVCVMAVAATLIGAYRASQGIPDFYQQALESASVEQSVEAGNQFEHNMMVLGSELKYQERWEALFTDDEVNGWLAVDLPEKFPAWLPRGIKDPRVSFSDDRAQLACRYEGSRLQTILSLETEVYLTEDPNVVAIRLLRARAGVLPLPLRRVIDNFTKVAKKTDLQLRWSQKDGDPVALVTIPVADDEDYGDSRQLDSLEFRDGEIYLSGSVQDETESASPQNDMPEESDVDSELPLEGPIPLPNEGFDVIEST